MQSICWQSRGCSSYTPHLLKYTIFHIPRATPGCCQVCCANDAGCRFFCEIVCVRNVLYRWCLGFCENRFVVVVYFNDNVFVNAPHYSVNVALLIIYKYIRR